MNKSDFSEINEHLGLRHYETARRLCLCELAGGDNARVLILLHDAYLGLDDVRGCIETLERIKPANEEERFEVLLLQVKNAERLAREHSYQFYRISPEAKAGLTIDEFCAKWRRRADEFWRQLDLLAEFEARRQAITETRRLFETNAVGTPAAKQSDGAETVASGALFGRLSYPDGKPTEDVTVTLGLKMEIESFDPATFVHSGIDLNVRIGDQTALTVRTDGEGRFHFERVPAGRHEFLAVSLNPDQFDIATRFLAEGIEIKPGVETELNLVVGEWASAPSYEVLTPFTPRLARSGVNYQRLHEEGMHNPFYYPFPRQELRFELPLGVRGNPKKLLLLSSNDPDVPQPFQVIGTEIVFFSDLPETTDRVVALYVAEGDGPAEPFADREELAPRVEPDGTAVIATGRAEFRIPFGEGRDALPPLLSVRGEDGVWRGKGRFKLPSDVEIISRQTQVAVQGPLVCEWTTRYQFSNGGSYELHFTAHRDEPYLLVHEISTEIENAAFEFSLSEFIGGRGFLHWKSEDEGLHWSTLNAEDRELARLQESVPWWIPPAGFGYAMTPGGPEEKDFIALFTIRRGEWIDRKFERLAQGPIDADGKENREIDWPFPEMVGSTISMITAHTTPNEGRGDAFFRLGFFNGERRWGLLVSTLERNDVRVKEIASVQHKNSSPRLQHFKQWDLDCQDRVTRPFVIMCREELRALRKKKDAPQFRAMLEKMHVRKGAEAGALIVEGTDPVAIWRKKKELATVAPLRSRMVLLGRDWTDIYSPVGARQATLYAEDYDLLAGTGVFSVQEERSIRAYFILMGHMFMEADLMNWHYNSRNANFEADRVQLVGMVGLAFHGHPCSGKFLQHGIELMERTLNIYCTPGSGRWYENPACYYLAALGPRVNLAFYLARHGIFDPTRIERFKDFLRWGILLLTPAFPHDYPFMYKACSDEDYGAAGKVRRIPPIGDHARLGTWVPEHFALMAKLYRAKDPAFADALRWAYQAGGSDGGYFGNLPAAFSALDEDDLKPVPAPLLVSRRLEGFGAVFRGGFETDREFYLLIKQGPGGYRYHRTEGSIVMFADGKPLIYDGGEAGETWRHTTLSFYDVHMPLAPGHVERFYSFAGIDFCQGVHPVAIKPGEPIQFCDDCHHRLVPVSWARYAEPNPVDVRSVLWVKDEYVILHDDLRLDPAIPSYWHAQIVAESQTGNARDGYIFAGRFGTDLQLVLPGQSFIDERCTVLPQRQHPTPEGDGFVTRHLQLTGDKPDHYLAVLRPLAGGKQPLRASEIYGNGKVCGVKVEGEGINDLIFLAREAFSFTESGMQFEGRYGAIIKRVGSIQLALLEGAVIEAEGIRIESSKPAVFVTLGSNFMEIVAEGEGIVNVANQGKTTLLRVIGSAKAMIPF